ncbi:hypothetical protein AAKU67_002701 [Oxalobacteraceae bacterium GrIS 2.11]
MKNETVKRKFLQKKIKEEYKKYKGHKEIKLGKVFALGNADDTGCNWSISIARGTNWEAAADFIRPTIIELRKKYQLAED